MRLCAAGVGCVSYDPRTQQAGTAHRAPLCPACCQRTGLQISALARDYADLEGELMPTQRGLGARSVSSGDDTGTPLAVGVEALQRSILWALTVWEPPVREAAGLPPERTRGVREGWAVAAAVRVLAPRVEVLAALGPTWGYAEGLDAGPVARDGIWAVGDLCHLHRQARTVCGLTRRTFHLPGECSRCGASALLRVDGADIIRCGRCDQRWTDDDYRQYVSLTLAQMGVT